MPSKSDIREKYHLHTTKNCRFLDKSLVKQNHILDLGPK